MIYVSQLNTTGISVWYPDICEPIECYLKEPNFKQWLSLWQDKHR